MGIPPTIYFMKPTVITKTCKLPDGREITIETGKLARQADGAVVLKMGTTMLLATVVGSGCQRRYRLPSLIC